MDPSLPLPNALIIGDVEQPMLRVQAYTPADQEQRTPLSLSPAQLTAFNALLHHVPGVAMGRVKHCHKAICSVLPHSDTPTSERLGYDDEVAWRC